MKIIFPEISQADFDYAIDCLEDCKHSDAAEYGFNHPYFAPGGAYGRQWWQLDSSLALGGYKWIDRKFAEVSLWNFIESQKENGRICLWGADDLPKYVAGGNFPKQHQGVSSLPKIFDVTYHLLQGSADERLKQAAYNMLKKYLNWWFEYRKDEATGLITAVFEETFVPYLGSSGEYAPVDTNTEVYVGCHYTQLMAQELGDTAYADILQSRKERLKESINKYLWNEEKGAYYPYDILQKKNTDFLMASTFYPLRLNIAEQKHKERLLKLLKDHECFNWDTIPLTSVSKTDKCFTTTVGNYQGNASWSGNVWTLINEMVVRGLVDCGEGETAAQLALKTLYCFRSNCTEFINPFDGTGHGVKKYAWTASQFIQLIVEVIFGISYNASAQQLTVSPNLPCGFENCDVSLEGLKTDAHTSADIHIKNGKISCTLSDDKIKIVTKY
ncbi:MAG: hypothetical protein IJO52_06160 [Clostridia bacterium]|nr:hypothetical protein [Clostridia bacterium]